MEYSKRLTREREIDQSDRRVENPIEGDATMSHPKTKKPLHSETDHECEEIEIEEEECIHCGGRGCEYCMPDEY